MNWLPYIVMLGLIVAGLGIVWHLVSKAETSGHAEAENEQKGAVLDAIVEHQATKNAVDALPADDARRRLQQWSRD